MSNFLYRVVTLYYPTLLIIPDAVMHMYTHDKLWPEMSDLAAALGSKCQIIDADSGGNCFDEACSSPWDKLSAQFPGFPIPMACQSTTVELRGEYDVSLYKLLC